MNKKNVKVDLKDQAFEMALLSGICQYGVEAFVDVDYVTLDTFTDQTNQILFDIVKSIIVSGNNPDVSSIFSKANSMGFGKLLEKDEEISYIRGLFNFPINKSNITNYAKKLTKLKILRDAKKVFDIARQKIELFTGEEDITEIMSSIEDPISKLTQEVYNTNENKPVEIGSKILEYVQNILTNPVQFLGIPTGFEEYDKAIGGGLREGCVDIMAARPKIGKSTFALQVALNVDKLDIPVLILDSEMDTNSEMNRLIANISSVNVNNVAKGDKAFAKQMLEAAKNFQNSKIEHINVSGMSFDNILSIARQWIYRKVGFKDNGKANKCVIIYDYLKLTTGSSITDSMKEYQILGFQMTDLHNFCVKYGVPCLTFVQLNKEDDISQSDRILWLCTSYSRFREKSQEEQADDIKMGIKIPFNRKIEPMVARYGPPMEYGDYINLRMSGDYARVVMGPTRNKLMKREDKIDAEVPDISKSGQDTDDSGVPFD